MFAFMAPSMRMQSQLSGGFVAGIGERQLYGRPVHCQSGAARQILHHAHAAIEGENRRDFTGPLDAPVVSVSFGATSF
jgi:hypothetical protein